MAEKYYSGIASELASKGRYGDSTLMHVNQMELEGLGSLGPVTINPDTGLPEAFAVSIPLALALAGAVGGGIYGGVTAKKRGQGLGEGIMIGTAMGGLGGYTLGSAGTALAGGGAAAPGLASGLPVLESTVPGAVAGVTPTALAANAPAVAPAILEGGIGSSLAQAQLPNAAALAQPQALANAPNIASQAAGSSANVPFVDPNVVGAPYDVASLGNAGLKPYPSAMDIGFSQQGVPEPFQVSAPGHSGRTLASPSVQPVTPQATTFDPYAVSDPLKGNFPSPQSGYGHLSIPEGGTGAPGQIPGNVAPDSFYFEDPIHYPVVTDTGGGIADAGATTPRTTSGGIGDVPTGTLTPEQEAAFASSRSNMAAEAALDPMNQPYMPEAPYQGAAGTPDGVSHADVLGDLREPGWFQRGVEDPAKAVKKSVEKSPLPWALGAAFLAESVFGGDGGDDRDSGEDVVYTGEFASDVESGGRGKRVYPVGEIPADSSAERRYIFPYARA